MVGYYDPSPADHSLLRTAILSSLLIIIFHGLVDDIVYRYIVHPFALLRTWDGSWSGSFEEPDSG